MRGEHGDGVELKHGGRRRAEHDGDGRTRHTVDFQLQGRGTGGKIGRDQHVDLTRRYVIDSGAEIVDEHRHPRSDQRSGEHAAVDVVRADGGDDVRQILAVDGDEGVGRVQSGERSPRSWRCWRRCNRARRGSPLETRARAIGENRRGLASLRCYRAQRDRCASFKSGLRRKGLHRIVPRGRGSSHALHSVAPLEKGRQRGATEWSALDGNGVAATGRYSPGARVRSRLYISKNRSKSRSSITSTGVASGASVRSSGFTAP